MHEAASIMQSGIPVYFDDIVLGTAMQSQSHVVTLADIVAFGRLTLDETPLHVDAQFARKTVFGGQIAHGLFGLALIEGLKSKAGLFDETAVASLSWDRVQFRRPVYPGDEVRAAWTFIRATEQPGQGRGIVVEETHLLDKLGRIAISAQHTFLVKCR
jgi:acyl dehydratase